MKAKVIAIVTGVALLAGVSVQLANEGGKADDTLAFAPECAQLALPCESGARSWEVLAGMRR